MAGDEDHARGLARIAAAQDGINIVQRRGLGDARVGAGQRRLHKRITMHLKTAAAGLGDGFKLRFDPVGGGENAGVRRQIFVETGEGAAIVERDEGGNRMLNLSGRNLRDGVGDGRVRRHGPDRCADCIQIAVGGIGRRRVRLTVGGKKSGRKHEAGGETECNHDYRVCLRAVGRARLLTRGVILFKTSEGAGESDRMVLVRYAIEESANNISPVNGVIQMEAELVFCAGGIHADMS